MLTHINGFDVYDLNIERLEATIKKEEVCRVAERSEHSLKS
jgi:hypothetical protein